MARVAFRRAPVVLAITTASLPSVQGGSAYSYQLTASGGTLPYTWSLVSAPKSLNTWKVSASGLITGTPTVAETDTLVIQVVDKLGLTTLMPFSLLVASAAANDFKWNPTLYAMSVTPPGGASNLANWKTEINCYVASLKANPTLYSIVGGWTFYLSWYGCQPTSQGVYTFTGVIDVLYNYLQQQMVAAGFSNGAQFVVQPTCYSNWLGNFSSTAGKGVVPDYIYNGGPALYGNSSQGGVNDKGGVGSGWALTNYNQPSTGEYEFVVAETSNPNVSAEYAKFQVALANYAFLIQYGPSAGQTLSLANNPLVEAIIDYTPSEQAGYGSGNPTTPSSFSGANFIANWKARSLYLRQNVPNMITGQMYEYTSSGMANTDLEGIIDYAASIGGALSCTDCYWSGSALDYTLAQTYWNGTASGSASQIGKTSSFPTVQSFDYWKTAVQQTSVPNSAAQVQAILQKCCYAGLGADHVALSMTSNDYNTGPGGTAFNFNLANWYDTSKTGTAGNGFIVNGILAALGIPSANKARPSVYA